MPTLEIAKGDESFLNSNPYVTQCSGLFNLKFQCIDHSEKNDVQHDTVDTCGVLSTAANVREIFAASSDNVFN